MSSQESLPEDFFVLTTCGDEWQQTKDFQIRAFDGELCQMARYPVGS
jgi:hypothetical protein